MSEVIKLFVGADPNGADAESMAVLEYTAKTNSSLPVEITWMQLSHDPESLWGGWATQNWATPFSGFRWAIPEVCGFEGRAIYCDSDFIFFGDLANLWNQCFEPGKVAMAKGGSHNWRYCLTMWDCQAAQKYILPLARLKKLPESHQRMMTVFATNQSIVQPFEGDWNNVDGEGKQVEDIDALHYSSMSSQFHLKYALPRLEAAGQKHWFDGQVKEHPRQDLQAVFDQLLEDAQQAGYCVSDYVPGGNARYGDVKKQSQSSYQQGNQWA